jgi:hypothetical protein
MSWFIGRIRQAAAAIGSALDRMGGNSNLSNITVLFTNYVLPREDAAHGGFQDLGGSGGLKTRSDLFFQIGMIRSPIRIIRVQILA